MFSKIKYSFSARLNFYLLLSITFIFITVFGLFYYYAARYIENEAYQRINGIAEKTNLRVARLLRTVEKIPDNMSWMFTDYVKTPEAIFEITRKVVRNNPEIIGCAIAFEPYYFPDEGCYFSPYSYMKDDSVVTVLIDSAYDYHHKYWYRRVKELDSPSWSKPYRDFGAEELLTTTYSVPLHDDSSRFIGVFSVDLATRNIKELIDENLPYPNSYSIVIHQDGNYIIRTGNGNFSLEKESVFDTDIVKNDSAVRNIILKITAGETGKNLFYENGIKSYIFYAPVSGTEWGMAVVSPYDDIFGGLHYFNILVLIFFLLFLLAIYGITSTTVKRITGPLKTFALSARAVAHGNFTAPLPHIGGQDEMKELSDSFLYMQHQLTEYIRNLQETSVAKEKIESELRIAHRIQMEMLPKNFFLFDSHPQVDLYAVLYPARHVGGDLYDFLIVENDLYFAIGDVSGKGVPASLLMAMTISLLRSLCAKHSGPAAIAAALNNSIAERTQSDMYVTFFVGMLNLKNGLLRYCNAGHVPPVMTSPDRSVAFFDVHADLPLGIIENYEYTEYTYTFLPGSGILLYTDGLTDAENKEQHFYGKERLLELVKDNHHLFPQEFIEAILQDVRAYSGPVEQTDDLTLLTLIYGENWRKGKK